MQHDLRRPLQRRSLLQRLWAIRPSALRACTFTLIAGLTGLAAWLVVNHEPYGGEPVVHMQIDLSDPIATSSTGQVEAPGASARHAAIDGNETVDVPLPDDADVVDLSDLGSAPEGETDFERRQRELLAQQRADETGDAASPGALTIDQLARSRETAAVQPAQSNSTLIAAPVAKVSERSRYGVLPRIAKDGTRVASLYARQVPQQLLAATGPKVALLIGGMGLNPELTMAAIKQLPPEVSLAFAPYGEQLQELANVARAAGHEIFLQLPMEPFGYPSVNPGPRTLLASADAATNLDNLRWHLGRFAGYAGVTNYLGAQFASKQAAISPVLKELGKRGLVYVDDGSKGLSRATRLALQLGVPAQSAVVSLDGDGTPQSVMAALNQLEQLAVGRSGPVIATGSGLPATLEAIAAWARELPARNVRLVPVSAVFAARQS